MVKISAEPGVKGSVSYLRSFAIDKHITENIFTMPPRLQAISLASGNKERSPLSRWPLPLDKKLPGDNSLPKNRRFWTSKSQRERQSTTLTKMAEYVWAHSLSFDTSNALAADIPMGCKKGSGDRLT